MSTLFCTLNKATEHWVSGKGYDQEKGDFSKERSSNFQVLPSSGFSLNASVNI